MSTETQQGNTVVETTYVRSDHNRHIVCVFSRGPRVTHYLGLEAGAQLTVCQQPNEQFDRLYSNVPERSDYSKYSALDFALAYVKDTTARTMIPIAPSALRVLMAIIKGQAVTGTAGDPNLNLLESIMAAAKSEATTEEFRKPDGPVAKVHKYLDSRVEAIKAGKVSRKELIEKLVEKEISAGTATTQAGVWARNNGVTFARPAQAKEEKKAAKKTAAKKTAAA